MTTALQNKPKRGKAAAVGTLLDRRVRRPRVQTLGRSPDAFNGRYKDCDIGITRGASGNWYIVVILESGMRAYDGYWRDSAHRSLDDAITEACTGACLWTANVAGNRLAEGKSELTGLLGGPARSEKD